jgi:tetratricopeptide (TPR) repeat protein
MITQSVVFALFTQLMTIDGQVRDARSHAPISYARVELSNAQVPVDQQFTDGEGHFRFRYVSSGPYMISVAHSMYESFTVEMDVPMNTFPVIVGLVRKKTPSTSRAPVVTVRELLVPERARKEFERARKEAQQDCGKAVGYFEKGLRAFDRDPSVYNDLGNCYRKLGNLGSAEDSFKRAQSLSDSVYVALNLAEVYSAQNRFDDAAAVLHDAIRKKPDDGDGYYGLALLYVAQGLQDQAEAAAIDADARPHRIPDIHLLLAEIYSKRGEIAETRRQLESFLKEAPKRPVSESVRKELERLKLRQ